MSLVKTNARRLKMNERREMIIRIWFYLSWAGVPMQRAPTTRKLIER